MDIQRAIRLQQWANDLREANESGLGKKAWCRLHNISYSTFAYRERELKKEFKKQQGLDEETSLSTVEFVELPTELIKEDTTDTHSVCSSEIKIEIDQAKLTIPSNISHDKLRLILEVAFNVQ